MEKVCLEILTMYRERRNSGYADILWDTDEFWTEAWLIRWFGEQKQKVYDILEPWVSSTALSPTATCYRRQGGASALS